MNADYCMWFTILILGLAMTFLIDSMWTDYLNAKYHRSDEPEEEESDDGPR